MKPLERAIACANGVGKLAVAVGVTQNAVSNWRSRGTSPDDKHCVRIERATRGLVTVEELRPHHYWLRIPDPSWPNKGGRPVLDYAMDEAPAAHV